MFGSAVIVKLSMSFWNCKSKGLVNVQIVFMSHHHGRMQYVLSRLILWRVHMPLLFEVFPSVKGWLTSLTSSYYKFNVVEIAYNVELLTEVAALEAQKLIFILK